uniref:UBC core domain-containing protein n=1 Tax=Arcella intermedia TaxID=1963864 RepID=A0A6B2LIA3_9EUKA
MKQVLGMNLEWLKDVQTGEDIRAWDCHVEFPAGTPYEGGVFRVKLSFPPEYPFRPCTITFTTPVYHPAIHPRTGEVCQVDSKFWSPQLKAITVIEQIRNSFLEPIDSNYVMNEEAKDLWRHDRRAFERTARQWAIKYCMTTKMRYWAQMKEMESWPKNHGGLSLSRKCKGMVLECAMVLLHCHLSKDNVLMVLKVLVVLHYYGKFNSCRK